jgi:cyclophilin family peptidyl-prolyl cis-trans isomerase
MLRPLPFVLLVAVVAAGCGGGDDSDGSGSGGGGGETAAAAQDAAGCRTVEAPAAEERTAPKPSTRLDPSKRYGLTLRTNCGSFTILLDVKRAPTTSASLVSLARRGYFDHTIFHRIVPEFVIQGGDPTASGSGGPGYQTVDKPPASAAYTHGVVAMAKAQDEPAGTSGSQFFVVTADDAGLAPDYAIVGKVAKGLGVVDRIGRLGGADEQPTQTVEIEKATVAVGE